ncbi:MAG TPA: ATP-binding cassette domain-containing protein [Thermoanaerobaculia bacterium]|nr:ATP-binding cassette domain-containing protein [Thermoanaerobaculia bacterium]
MDRITCRLGDVPTTFLLGANGAGKTVFLNVVSGFDRASGGSISWQDKNITRLHPTAIAKRGIARAFQIPRLVPSLAVWQHIALSVTGRYASVLEKDENVLQWASASGLLDRLETQAMQLSAGQRKMLSLAMCLAREPKLALLDEPFAGVSKENRRLIRAILESSRQRLRFVIIEHDHGAVAEFADRAIVMDRGKLVADGSWADIRHWHHRI